MFNSLRTKTAKNIASYFSTQLAVDLAAKITTLNDPTNDQLNAEVQEFLSQFNERKIFDLLEKPKNSSHGHLSLPVFTWAKVLKVGPPVVAKVVADGLSLQITHAQQTADFQIEEISAIAGFINIRFSLLTLFAHLESAIRLHRENEQRIGSNQSGRGRRVVIDYSSPNVAKPMHIGHLRATVVGQAIRNIAETQGYEVIGLNHLGDWGVQFGKLAWAYQNWGSQFDFANNAFQSLFELYVKFHEEAEKDPELEKLGSLTFKKLEDGDVEIQKIWKMFVETTLKENQKILNLLGVEHDLVRGESFYNDRLKSVEAMLARKGLLTVSQGAEVVDLGEDIPPCLIRKTDGASLYATRDLASAIYRHDELKADLNLYVVGFDQSLHFQQVFKVLEKCGFEWSKQCVHIAFGLYRFKEGIKMSTRKGQVVFLQDVLDQAIERTKAVIQQKNPQLTNDEQNQIAEAVGVGAVVFNDLIFDRLKNVEFDWDRILSFEGDSGPYVQYMYVRCASIFRKYQEAKGASFDRKQIKNLINTDTLKEALGASGEGAELIRLLLTYDEVLELSFQGFRPNVVAQYLLELCAQFSKFYHNNRILGEAPHIEGLRLSLVDATQTVLKEGLKVLSIRTPEYM